MRCPASGGKVTPSLGGDASEESLDALIALAERLLGALLVDAAPPTPLPLDQEIGSTRRGGRKFFGHRFHSAHWTATRRTRRREERHLDQDPEGRPLFILDDLEDLRVIDAKENREHVRRIVRP
jgi:hypothetical protein